MKFAAISDLHGHLPQLSKGLDTLLVAGDILPLSIQMNSKKSKQWLKGVFFPWCLENARITVFVGGNHDFWLERHGKDDLTKILPPEIIYLENNCTVLDGKYIIYGTPLCQIFGNWAFMAPQYMIEEKVESLKEDKDSLDPNDSAKSILLTHDAPYGISDVLLQDVPWNNGEHIGNPALRKLVEYLRPNYHLHGHLHSTEHEAEQLGRTEIRNVSILDENYIEAYEPFYFEF